MIKMFVMHTCPDCEYVEKQVEGNPNFEVIDIGKHVRNLKKFLDLRDSHPAFDEAKAIGDVGIPCYVLEDGTATLYSKDVGLEPRPDNYGDACRIDGKGCQSEDYPYLCTAMKVDCHCHILPEIDDGSWCLEVSADLARRQVAWGFERAISPSWPIRSAICISPWKNTST